MVKQAMLFVSVVLSPVVVGTPLTACAEQTATSVEIAKGSRSLLPIIVADNAGDRVWKAAGDLETYLEKITGAEFSVEVGNGKSGIVVGRCQQFPALDIAVGKWSPSHLEHRERYLLKTHKHGVWLLGASELAVEHAVWDFLYRIGYRQFFPNANWEIVPQVPDLTMAVDAFESPDFLARRIWYGYGMWDYNAEPYADWCARNRCVAGIQLSTGHSYDGVVRSMRDQFEQHPEYWPLLDGQRQPVKNPKPCLGNPEVRALFVQHALQRFENDPDLDSISVDPSDGGGWCQCERCAKLGSISDQAVTLANEVAAAVDAKFPGKLVGMYAYNYHSPPPNIKVHPNVVISVATAFIKGGLTLDEIIRGWAARGATLGIREYYGVNVWDRDLPGRARGGNLAYLQRTIPDFHAKGARFMSAESSDNWGPNGLGYYLASRMLWDVREAKDIDDLQDDFFVRSFGAAQQPMREFYRQLDSGRPHLVFDDQLGRMFRALREAKRVAAQSSAQSDTQSAVIARIDDLALYARYVDLFQRYSVAEGPARQAAFEQMTRHSYRMRQTMMIHSKAIYRDVVARDKSVSIPDGATWGVPEKNNPWKSSEPFSESEIASFVREGIERYQTVELGFEPVSYSQDLVPADGLNLGDVKPSEAPRGRGTRHFFCYIENAPAEVTLTITGGLIAHYRDRGNVRVELWQVGGASESGEKDTLVAADRSVPPDGKTRTITLPVKETGLYKLSVADGGDLTSVTWPAGRRICFESSLEQPIKTNGRWSLYFYVPRGTKVFGLHGGGTGTIIDADGQEVLTLNGRDVNFYSIPIGEGQDGRLWKINHAAGPIRLLTVPPYLARSADELLLPREVVQRDMP